MASLTEENAAVYLHERGHHIYKRVRSPTVGEVLQLTREERNDHDRLLCAEFDHLQLSLSGIALPLLFVRWLAIHGSLESARCFSACHLVVSLTCKHGIHHLETSAILTCVTSGCAN